MSISCLEARGLRFQPGDRPLIDDLSLTLPPGEMMALIGPNGAGKSTLLRLLSGFITPDSGECRLNGRPLTHWDTRELARQRAVMRQHSQMAFSWPVEEVIAMGRAPWNDAVSAPLLDEIMTVSGCAALAGRDVRQLSGGEMQRVQLARALAQLWQADGPRGWLFLDEPTSALDLHYQQHTLGLLKRLTAAGGLHVCIIIHDLNLAALWADRLVLLHAGRIVADGSPGAVLETGRIHHCYQADVHLTTHPEYPVPQILLRREG
ncbi:heme ABC transporter ATP-binding protein [Entomohabitans teleogrylli]|uniref:heme ABC transporter ATP-binding protein n=1 Tax=Entomohabitans teleogrylli TaxID=1384589 RepID=UPI00073DA97D|nr:heme ABC transporter ATP-binding protein [Entomohabitans teleogrylli]